jgi:MYXO-CTERM domain-containing protein
MSALLLTVLLAAPPLHFEADVSSGDGDYTLVPFTVPAGTAEIQIDHTDGSDVVILDWGVWAPDGFRGWGGGLTAPAIIGVDMSSRGYVPGPIVPGTWTLVIGEAKLSSGTGHYSVDVTFRDAPTLAPVARAPFAARVLATGPAWYKGDFHVHDEESGDAAATFAQIEELARSRGLDFVELTDHNTVSQQGRQAAEQQGLDDLLLIRGIEVTTYAGHGNALGASSYVDHRVGLGGVGAATILDAVAAEGAVFIVNHPTLEIGDLCIGCAWKLPSTPWAKVTGLEIQNGNYLISGLLFTPKAIAMWDMLEDQGYRLAATGGSDDHTAGMNEGVNGSPIGSPSTLVYAGELSEAAILAGVKAGRTVVLMRGPDDPRVEMTVKGANGTLAAIGDTATGVSTIELDARVTGVAAGDGVALSIVRDGLEADQVPVPGGDFQHTFTYPVRGGHERIRAELIADGNRIVVTSHIYVDGVVDSGGCAVGAGGSASRWLVVVLMLGAFLVRRR